ncbi:hypothetical protein LCGC14_2754190 [marine sediment metagenome]|uniref:Uncharacterized protein n=1 Tax=marine sediment metagenome TaxID=412755 RepID=A0A0F8Z0S0_9ZZZZ
MPSIDEFSSEDTSAPIEDTTYCRCCGGKAEMDTFCLQCHHRYNEWCARGDGRCPNCGYVIDNEGKCGRCGHQRTKENTRAIKSTNCDYCGSMLDVDGSCIRSKSHGQPSRTL